MTEEEIINHIRKFLSILNIEQNFKNEETFYALCGLRNDLECDAVLFQNSFDSKILNFTQALLCLSVDDRLEQIAFENLDQMKYIGS